MCYKALDCDGLQGAEDARRRARRRPFVTQVSENDSEAVLCQRLQIWIGGHTIELFINGSGQ